MPKSDELATEFKSLQELAMKIDEHPDQAEELVAATKAPESRPEPVADDHVEETAPEEETPEVEPAQTAEIEPEDIEPKEGDSDYVRKEKERFAKNWQIYQKRDQESKTRVQAAEERARKAEEEASKLRSTPAKSPYKDERGNTVEDYETYADQKEQEGDWQVAKNARQEAVIARQKAFLAEWHANRIPIMEANPDLQNMATPLAKEVDRLINEPDNPFVTRTTGLKYAVIQAKANLASESVSAIRAENEKLKKELNRLEKLGAIPGRDGAMKRVSQKAFEEMSLEQQRAQLLRQSEELDAESMRY